MNPTDEERKNWWILAYAISSWGKCIESCQLLLNHTMSNTDPLFLPLAISVHALYGRPFKAQRGAGKILNEWVPEEHLERHLKTIDTRDRLLVHNDANAVSKSGEKVNYVTYLRKKDPADIIISSTYGVPSFDHFKMLTRMVPQLREKARHEIVQYHERFHHLLPTSPEPQVFLMSGPEIFASAKHFPDAYHF